MSDKPLVILLHGLHQRGFIMRPLALRLNKLGYRTHNLSYRSLVDSVATHSDRLNQWLEAYYNHNDHYNHHNIDTPLHLVGHSLGGLVMRDFLSRYPQWTIGRCVTLGTPHLGSVSANYVKKLLPPLVGNAYKQGLDGTLAPLPAGISLGVIAGDSPKGLGQLFLNYHKRQAKLSAQEGQHDGTVYVTETRLPNAADYIILPVSHTGMLLNKEVARQTAYFLEQGKFDS